MDGGLDAAATGLHRSTQVLFWNPSGAKHVSVGEPLSGNVADGKLRQNNLGKDANMF